MKIREVIEKILAYHPAFPKDYDGCDSYKCGDPEKECTGIVTALTPNIAVIRKAIEHGANLIIVHEPTFYTSEDGPGWYADYDNEVYEKKRRLLDEHGITVWRDHDHMHAHQPDAIFAGVLKYLGWEENSTVDHDTGLYAHYLVDIEETTVKALCDHLIEKIGLNGVRIVGDPQAKVRKLALVGHLFPCEYRNKDGTPGEYGIRVMEAMEKGADVILPGEVIDWTVLSYVRDAVDLGMTKAVINVGHFNWEELGMKYMKDWLPELLNEEIPVTYVPSGDMYRFVTKGEKE